MNHVNKYCRALKISLYPNFPVTTSLNTKSMQTLSEAQAKWNRVVNQTEDDFLPFNISASNYNLVIEGTLHYWITTVYSGSIVKEERVGTQVWSSRLAEKGLRPNISLATYLFHGRTLANGSTVSGYYKGLEKIKQGDSQAWCAEQLQWDFFSSHVYISFKMCSLDDILVFFVLFSN